MSAFRLQRHHLVRRVPRASLVDAVRDVCGVQAQVTSAAEIALWARVRDLRRDDIERALWRDRTLVKTRCMRSTVHLVPAADVTVFPKALARSISARLFDRWVDRRGVGADVKATTQAILEALSETALTRRELSEGVAARLGAAKREWGEGGWGHAARSYVPGWILGHLCFSGLVCFGPNRGAETTFVRLSSWLPSAKEMTIEAAETTLLRSYLRAFGPATLHDFAYWAYLTLSDARRIRGVMGDDLVEADAVGTTRLLLREDRTALTRARTASPVLRLLPSFDSYLLGHRAKGHLVDAAHYKRVYRNQGWLSPVVLMDGRAIGVWSYRQKGERLAINVEPFGALSTVVRSRIEDEAGDLGRFLEGAAEVTFARRA